MKISIGCKVEVDSSKDWLQSKQRQRLMLSDIYVCVNECVFVRMRQGLWVFNNLQQSQITVVCNTHSSVLPWWLGPAMGTDWWVYMRYVHMCLCCQPLKIYQLHVDFVLGLRFGFICDCCPILYLRLHFLKFTLKQNSVCALKRQKVATLQWITVCMCECEHRLKYGYSRCVSVRMSVCDCVCVSPCLRLCVSVCVC